MTGKPAGMLLSSRALETMKSDGSDKADVGENRGLRVSCGKTGVKSFFCRYTSSVTGKLVQVKIGNFPQVSLAIARTKLHETQVAASGRAMSCD